MSQGATSESVVSINDNDGSGGGLPDGNKGIPVGEGTDITVNFEQTSYTAREGSTATIKVILSADPQRTISIPFTTTSGTGLTSGDYSGLPASVDFTSGDTEKSFILTAVQDQDDEIDETLTLEFGTLPVGVSSGDNTQATFTIVDSIRVSFGASNYEAYEGGVGAQVIVKLDSPAPNEIVIPITAIGMNGATSADWTGVPSNVTFASGDTQKNFIVMAYDDDVEDDGERVEISFGNLPAGVVKGTPSVTSVELMNMEVPTCETAVWCAAVEFAHSGSDDWSRPGLGLGYHTTQEPYLRYSSLSENRFTFRGKEYQVWSMFTSPGTHPDVSPGSPGRIPEYSTFSIRLMEVVQGELKMSVDQDHRRDWTLYIDGIALPFTDVVSMTSSGSSFVWHHPKLQELYADWTDGDTYEVMIAEDPVSERPNPPVTIPTAPRYLRVMPGDGILVAQWKQPLKDGNSDITHYRLQWKLGTESWSNPNAIEEVTVQPPGGKSTEVFHMIAGLTNYTSYSLRVFAVNGVGHSEPSDEHFGMPQKESLHVSDTAVNGNQLAITYERTLDDSSIPSPEAFWVLVNGAPRNVTGVSISGRLVILTLDEPAKRVIRASDDVEFRYVTPPSGTPAIKDIAGNYAYSCEFGEDPSMARNVTDRGLLEPVTAEFTMVPDSHTGAGSEVVFQIEFSEPVRVDIGRNHAHLLDVEGGRVVSAWWLDGDSTIWEIVLEPNSNGEVSVTLPGNRACGAAGAPCGSGERRLTNQPERTISGSSMSRASNSPASGGPGIAGTPQTGQTLTATTTGIQDLDGMSGAVFAYQWIRHSLKTATNAEIIGATGQTYTVTSKDEGIALKVEVTFIDDAGNEESLTSIAVIISPVGTRDAEPVNSPATGSPGIEGSPVAGQTLTATTSGIEDDDGMSKAVFAYQWLEDDAEIDGATSSSYTVDAGDVGKALKVRVSFNDNAGNPESLASDATSAVEPKPADEDSDDPEEQTSSTSLTAEFQDVPDSHDGETSFTIRVSFSEGLQNQSARRLRMALSVTGADVVKIRRVDKQRDLFEFILAPTGTDNISVSLDAFTGDCTDDNAVCTAEGEALSGFIQTQIAGP